MPGDCSFYITVEMEMFNIEKRLINKGIKVCKWNQKFLVNVS